MHSDIKNEEKIWKRISTFAILSFICSALFVFSLYLSPFYYMHHKASYFCMANWALIFLAIVFFLNIILIGFQEKMWLKISKLSILSYICGLAGLIAFNFLSSYSGGLYISVYSLWLIWLVSILLAIILGASSLIVVGLSKRKLKGTEIAIMGMILALASFFVGYPACFIW